MVLLMGALDGWRFCPICGEAIEKHEDRVECPACGYVGYANAVPGAEAVCFDADGRVLLGRRANDPGAGLWDLPGGFLHEDELPVDGLRREVREETGLDAARYDLRDWGIENRFEIFKKHRSRYAPGVTHNLEHVFSLSLPGPLPVTLDPAEHLSYEWLPWRDAAARTISWSNRDAILALPRRLGVSAR
jgi:dATP pyrophosphohydrolase